MCRFVFLLVSLGLLSAGAYADYDTGLQAYRAGDFATALAQWAPLADAGNVRAETAVASLYETGKGVAQNYQQAFVWYRKAADQGYAAAQVALGLFYAYGRGVTRDEQEAMKWYQKAADQGQPRAQNFIGYRYLRGNGVAQDYITAEMWFALSGPGSDQEDANARAEVARTLTPDQMTQALRRAQEWRANRVAQPVVRVAPAVPVISVTPTQPTSIKWSAGDPRCEQRWIDGNFAEIINLPGLQATVSLQETPNGLISAMVGVRNLSNVPVDVLPFNFSIQMTNPPGTKLAALPPEKAMATQGLAGTIAAVIAGGAQGWSDASQKQVASGTVTNSDGSTSQVNIYSTGPTQQEIDQRNQAAQDRRDEAAARDHYNQGIRGITLAANTLDPQKEVNGAVWFPREKKKYRELVIELPIGKTVMEFPFEFK